MTNSFFFYIFRSLSLSFPSQDGILGCEELTRFFPSGKVNIMLITWNMSGNHPPSELNDLLLPETLLYVPDIYAIAMQEMVFGEGKEIETQLQTTIGPSHVLLHSHIHGVLGLLIFVRRDLIWFFSLPEEAAYNVRPASMNMVKTKGAVGVSFSFFGTTFLFINSHLPAHEARNKERREAYERIISSFDLPRNLRPLKPRYISSDVTARFDVCFWVGDLNFRVERGYEETIQILEEIKAQKELARSGCVETGRIKRILGGRTTVNNNLGGKNGEDNASNTSLQGSVSSVDSSGLETSLGHTSLGHGQSTSGQGSSGHGKLPRRTSEPGTSMAHECQRINSDTHSIDNCYECLLRTDQLLKGMEERTIFNGFQEVSEITFAPTFKYDINGDNFDVEYHRVPSYTDRILARTKRPGHATCLAYDSIPDIKTSDHKPVFALMECQIRPGKDTIPLNAGLFKRDVYIEALRRRAEENFGLPAQASNCGVS